MPSPDQLYAEALAHLAARRFTEAEAVCREVLKLAPNHIDTMNLQGLAALRAGRSEQALAFFRKALKFSPKQVSLHLNAGLALLELNRLDEAERAFTDALKADRRAAEAHYQLAALALRQFKFSDAAAHGRAATELQPTHALSHAVTGEALVLLGRMAEAREALEKANALNTSILNVYDNLGITDAAEGRIDAAMARFDAALALRPDFPGSQFNRAVIRLRQGDLEGGLADYEARWRLPRTAISAAARPFQQAQWQGEPLNGRTLLLWGEQGVGDEIRLAVLARDLAQRGERVILECDKRLTELFSRSLQGVQVVARSDPPDSPTMDAAIGWQSPIESALRFVRPGLVRFPAPTAYLRADPNRTQELRAQLAHDGKPLVGLSWGSYNPQMAAGKTTTLDAWAPLLERDDVTFVRLQKASTEGGGAHALLSKAAQADGLDVVQDLDGLAALTAACDLVISVSNTTAHLAGALGVATRVLLPFGHFQPWYWFSGRTDSPWYPNVRLYRPTGFDDWRNLIGRVAAEPYWK
jgi:tetratricopeptide (TPR) repeat protein